MLDQLAEALGIGGEAAGGQARRHRRRVAHAGHVLALGAGHAARHLAAAFDGLAVGAGELGIAFVELGPARLACGLVDGAALRGLAPEAERGDAGGPAKMRSGVLLWLMAQVGWARQAGRSASSSSSHQAWTCGPRAGLEAVLRVEAGASGPASHWRARRPVARPQSAGAAAPARVQAETGCRAERGVVRGCPVLSARAAGGWRRSARRHNDDGEAVHRAAQHHDDESGRAGCSGRGAQRQRQASERRSESAGCGGAAGSSLHEVRAGQQQRGLGCGLQCARPRACIR